MLYNGPLYDTPGGSDLAAIRGAGEESPETENGWAGNDGAGPGRRRSESGSFFLEAPLEMPDAPGTVTMREAP